MRALGCLFGILRSHVCKNIRHLKRWVSICSSFNFASTITNFIFSSWIKSAYFIKKETKIQKYLACLHRAIVAYARSSHYLDMKTKEDIILNLFLSIIGFLGIIFLLSKCLPILSVLFLNERIVIILFIAQFSQLITTFHITIKRHLKVIQQLQEYMRYKELPYSLQRRLLTFYHYRNKKSFERNKKIIEEVSPYLREVHSNLIIFIKIKIT